MSPSSLSTSLLLLGIASAAFDVGCVLIKTPFLRPGVTAGDAIEAAGVFVVLVLFTRVARLAGNADLPRSGGAPREELLLVIAAAAFALGHGVHVAANSIHDLADRNGLGDATGLMSFWDEHAGHYLVDSARVLFAIALTSVGWTAGRGPGTARFSVSALAGGIAFGFTVFASAVEGQTVPLVLPFSALYAGWSVLVRDRFRRGGAVLVFFTAAAWTSLLFFAIWGVWQRGFPEFTRAGLVHSAH